MTSSFSQRHPPIPGYEPVRVLGYNGAVVYVARSTQVGRLVVLQVWDRGFSAHTAVLMGIEHPNILRVFEAGEVKGHSYVAFEYLDKTESLDQRLQRGPLIDSEARKLTMVIASALDFLRDAGVVVGGLTPGDVLLAEPPRLFLHPAHLHIPDPHFVAPEEALGVPQAVTRATDVYRVGALLYAMLTSHPPFAVDLASDRRQRPDPVEHRLVSPSQINPSVAKNLEAICIKCLEYVPTNRYASLRELGEALQRSA